MAVETIKVSPKSKKTKTTEDSSLNKKENCLFIRYRHRKLPPRDEIRRLHPSIIDVRLPRQKSAKFCHIEFESQAAAHKAVKQLRKDHGKEIIIQAFGVRIPAPASDDEDEDSVSSEEEPVPVKSKKINPTNCLRVSGLPLLAAEEVLKSLFPSSTKITVNKKTPKGSKRLGFVHFGTVEEAVSAAESSKGVSVNGEQLTVGFHE